MLFQFRCRHNMAVDDSYTKALLHMDGSDASTTFTDESGKTWTASGNAQIDTAQSVFGGASGLFDGSGDYISTADHADFYYPGDMTIDFRLRFNAFASGSVYGIYQQTQDGSNYYQIYFYNNGGTPEFTLLCNSGGVNLITMKRNPTISTSTWYHFALSRSGNDYMMFQDGTKLGATLTDSDTIPNLSASVLVGAASDYFNGWIDEFRISKGIARWTANFTPPTSAYAPAATSNFFPFF